MKEISMDRRTFLTTSATVTGGLIVSFYIPSPLEKAFGQAKEEKTIYPTNAFITITPDNKVTITINRLEMGQGPHTALSQAIAEELECDWTKISAVSSGVNPVYNTPGMPMQITGGSMSVRTSFEQYRKIGATMREMLKSAAAANWGVETKELKAENGFIVHPKKGKLSYGELTVAASKLPMPENPPLKDPKDYKIVGHSVKRLDAVGKSTGTAVYGIDVRLPGMLYAVISRPPLRDCKIIYFNEKAARAVKGVVDVVKFEDRIAVLAKNTHAARVGRDALETKWENPHAKLSTDDIMSDFKKRGNDKGAVADKRGDAEGEMKKAHSTFTAEYEFPFLSHAPMEPMNCTVNYDGKKADFYGGFQMPGVDQAMAAPILGLKPSEITMNVTYAGGSFGRRACKSSDYIVEAAKLAKVVKKPLKITWTREDDMHGGYYRPMNYHKAQIGLDAKNHLTAWHHHIVGHTVMGDSIMAARLKGGLEDAVTEGISESPYALTNFQVELTKPETPVTTLWWRSVGNTHTAFVMETLIDELAEKAKQDPLEFRRKLLQKSPRHIGVLDLLKKQTGWGTKTPPKGRAWGLAIHESFKSVVGQVAEVSVRDGQPIVHQVWAAAHIGQVVNPEQAKTQVEGGVIYALSAALNGQIQFKDGQVVQQNFNDYTVVRMNEAPVVHVEFVPSHEAPTGLGEPGVPPTAPAVANAIYKLTKKRLRKLPFSREMKA
jgi:isoquinoline 1-oxidoreductase subunit beta